MTILVSKRAVQLLIFSAAVLILAGMVGLVWVPKAICRAKLAEAKQNMHAIQLAVERFASDAPDSNYPASIDELLAAGYLPQLPQNPFTKLPMRALAVDLQAYSGKGPLVVPGARHGDFVYYPRYQGDEERPWGYTLFLY